MPDPLTTAADDPTREAQGVAGSRPVTAGISHALAPPASPLAADDPVADETWLRSSSWLMDEAAERAGLPRGNNPAHRVLARLARLAAVTEEHRLLRIEWESACERDRVANDLRIQTTAERDALREAVEPGKASGYVVAMFDAAHRLGHPRSSSTHALGFLVTLAERAAQAEAERDALFRALDGLLEMTETDPWDCKSQEHYELALDAAQDVARATLATAPAPAPDPRDAEIARLRDALFAARRRAMDLYDTIRDTLVAPATVALAPPAPTSRSCG